MPSSDDINSTFGDQWGLSLLLYVFGTCLDLVLYRFETCLVLILYRFGIGLILVLYKLGLEFWSSEVLTVWDMFHIEYYTGFRLVCQVRGTPQMYLRSFEVEGKP